MAGLLDSDFMRFLTDNKGYWNKRDQEQAAGQYQGLLGSLEQQGPTQPGQGLLGSREPDQQFWLKAAAIPGYEQMAGQQLGYEAAGNQAMGRQMQQQQYEGSHLSMAQRLQAELQQRLADFNEKTGLSDLQRKWYGTEASAAASGASAQSSQAAGLLSLEKLAGERDKNAKANGPLFQQLQPQQRLESALQLKALDSAAEGVDATINWLDNRATGSGLRGVGTGQGGAYSTDWNLSTIPILSKMVGSGALDDSERKWYIDMTGDPSNVVMTDNDRNKMKVIATKIKDYRANNYNALGLQAPPVSGRGAVQRTLGDEPSGQLKPYRSKYSGQ
jgi:hypothetical protein